MQETKDTELPASPPKMLSEMSLEELAEQRSQLKTLSYEQQSVDVKTTGELRRRLHKLGAELQEFRFQPEAPAAKAPKPPRKPIHWSALTVASILTFNSILALSALVLALSGNLKVPGMPAWAIILLIFAGALIFFIIFLAVMAAIIAVYFSMKQQQVSNPSYYPMQLPDEAPPWAEKHIDKSANLSEGVPVYRPGMYSDDPDLDKRLQDMERGVSVKSIKPMISDPFSEEF